MPHRLIKIKRQGANSADVTVYVLKSEKTPDEKKETDIVAIV